MKKIYPGHYIQNGGKNYRVLEKDGEMLYVNNGLTMTGVFEDEATIATDKNGRVLVQSGSEAWWEELILWIGKNLPVIMELITSLLLIFAKKQGKPNWYAKMVIGKKNIERFEQTVHIV